LEEANGGTAQESCVKRDLKSVKRDLIQVPYLEEANGGPAQEQQHLHVEIQAIRNQVSKEA